MYKSEYEKLQNKLVIAQNHFNNAVGFDEVENAIHELIRAENRITKYCERHPKTIQ